MSLGWGSISARIETMSVALQTVLEPVPVLNEKLDGMARQLVAVKER